MTQHDEDALHCDEVNTSLSLTDDDIETTFLNDSNKSHEFKEKRNALRTDIMTQYKKSIENIKEESVKQYKMGQLKLLKDFLRDEVEIEPERLKNKRIKNKLREDILRHFHSGDIEYIKSIGYHVYEMIYRIDNKNKKATLLDDTIKKSLLSSWQNGEEEKIKSQGYEVRYFVKKINET